MFTICGGCGIRPESALKEALRDPTRGDYLLDLALTDLDEMKCMVRPKLADHRGLWLTLPLTVPETGVVERIVWQFKTADWDGLRNALELHDWSSAARAMRR